MLDLSDKLKVVGWRRHAFLQWVDGRSTMQISKECYVSRRHVSECIDEIKKSLSDEDRAAAVKAHGENRSKWPLPKQWTLCRPICDEMVRIGNILSRIADTPELPNNSLPLCHYFNVSQFTMSAILTGTFDLDVSFLLRIADFLNITLREMLHFRMQDNVNIAECRRKLVEHHAETERLLQDIDAQQ